MMIACVDAGQTKTTLCLLNENAEVLCKKEDSPIIHPAKAGGLNSFREITLSLCDMLKDVNKDHELSICFSLSGYHGENDVVPNLIKQTIREKGIFTNSLHIVPDYIGNWFAATRGKPGIIIICGGGTVVYGKNSDGASYRFGGWGHLLGDEGSGYWIGIEAIKAALKGSARVTRKKTSLEVQLKNFLNYNDEWDLISSIYSGEISDKKIAHIVPIVETLAKKDDPICLEILNQAIDHLVNDCLVVMHKIGEHPLYLSGGLFNSKWITENLKRRFLQKNFKQLVQSITIDPITGAYYIAKNGL
ncbi:N-acetylglucosamine kinase-like BadF-type ATPase [Pullulanibacillus pueri]|uniref:N-acetylmuramic acid/N-acetylglucosamine kinase n=1 Tax=Pullulanibacillus pueri TaxID=1437324 RepID=A0A8J2ZYR7_9BACL|nr:BadF/BadG/BcrA/BcrD ATPase family protein [Pullulanibacillus pueri]MBM7683655.1 N-acetylglucosamine kinase-like BadF-type ATPase [Pullulanibacillus pueri]GGH87207.1 N-acetylmuramic acid/N-acetylglucosamine kinase [Pullulanibacillus pueri]